MNRRVDSLHTGGIAGRSGSIVSGGNRSMHRYVRQSGKSFAASHLRDGIDPLANLADLELDETTTAVDAAAPSQPHSLPIPPSSIPSVVISPDIVAGGVGSREASESAKLHLMAGASSPDSRPYASPATATQAIHGGNVIPPTLTAPFPSSDDAFLSTLPPPPDFIPSDLPPGPAPGLGLGIPATGGDFNLPPPPDIPPPVDPVPPFVAPVQARERSQLESKDSIESKSRWAKAAVVGAFVPRPARKAPAPPPGLPTQVSPAVIPPPLASSAAAPSPWLRLADLPAPPPPLPPESKNISGWPNVAAGLDFPVIPPPPLNAEMELPAPDQPPPPTFLSPAPVAVQVPALKFAEELAHKLASKNKSPEEVLQYVIEPEDSGFGFDTGDFEFAPADLEFDPAQTPSPQVQEVEVQAVASVASSISNPAPTKTAVEPVRPSFASAFATELAQKLVPKPSSAPSQAHASTSTLAPASTTPPQLASVSVPAPEAFDPTTIAPPPMPPPEEAEASPVPLSLPIPHPVHALDSELALKLAPRTVAAVPVSVCAAPAVVTVPPEKTAQNMSLAPSNKPSVSPLRHAQTLSTSTGTLPAPRRPMPTPPMPTVIPPGSDLGSSVRSAPEGGIGTAVTAPRQTTPSHRTITGKMMAPPSSPLPSLPRQGPGAGAAGGNTSPIPSPSVKRRARPLTISAIADIIPKGMAVGAGGIHAGLVPVSTAALPRPVGILSSRHSMVVPTRALPLPLPLPPPPSRDRPLPVPVRIRSYSGDSGDRDSAATTAVAAIAGKASVSVERSRSGSGSGSKSNAAATAAASTTVLSSTPVFVSGSGSGSTLGSTTEMSHSVSTETLDNTRLQLHQSPEDATRRRGVSFKSEASDVSDDLEHAHTDRGRGVSPNPSRPSPARPIRRPNSMFSQAHSTVAGFRVARERRFSLSMHSMARRPRSGSSLAALTWSKVAVLPSNISFMTVCNYDDSAYIFGGKSEDHVVHGALLRYDHETMKLAEVPMKDACAMIPPPRYLHAAVASEGSWFIHGGLGQDGSLLEDLWEYSFDNEMWLEIKLLNGSLALSGHSLVASAGHLYAFGGVGRVGIPSNAVYDINLHSGEVTAVSVTGTPPRPCQGHTAVVLENSDSGFNTHIMVVFGGHASDVADVLPVFHELDLSDKAWKENEPAGFVRWRTFHSACVQDNKMIIYGGLAGGSGNATVPGDLLEYNPQAGSWKSVSPLIPASRFGHCCITTSEGICVFGGERMSDISIYTFKSSNGVPKDQWESLAMKKYPGVLSLRERLRPLSSHETYGRRKTQRKPLLVGRTEVPNLINSVSVLSIIVEYLESKGMLETCESILQEANIDPNFMSSRVKIGGQLRLPILLKMAVKDTKRVFQDAEETETSRADDRSDENDVTGYVPIRSAESDNFDATADMYSDIWDNPGENIVSHVIVGGRESDVVEAGTFNSLVKYLTAESSFDRSFARAFFTALPSFASADLLLTKLIQRYHVPRQGSQQEDRATVEAIQHRVSLVVKMWLEDHPETITEKVLNQIGTFVELVMNADGGDKLPKQLRAIVQLTREKIKATDEERRKDIRERITHRTAPPDVIIPATIFSRVLALIDVDSLEIARQLTILQFDSYCTIRPQEMLHKAWLEPDSKDQCRNVVRMINLRAAMALWVSKIIANAGSSRAVAKLVDKMVSLANQLLILRNYSSIFAVVDGLIQGLAVVDGVYDPDELVRSTANDLREFIALVSPANGYEAYYKSLSRSKPPSIPHLDVLLDRIEFIEDEEPNLISSNTGQPMINFKKRRTMCELIFEFSAYQAAPYNLHPVYQISSLIEDQLESQSQSAPPKSK